MESSKYSKYSSSQIIIRDDFYSALRDLIPRILGGYNPFNNSGKSKHVRNFEILIYSIFKYRSNEVPLDKYSKFQLINNLISSGPLFYAKIIDDLKEGIFTALSSGSPFVVYDCVLPKLFKYFDKLVENGIIEPFRLPDGEDENKEISKFKSISRPTDNRYCLIVRSLNELINISGKNGNDNISLDIKSILTNVHDMEDMVFLSIINNVRCKDHRNESFQRECCFKAIDNTVFSKKIVINFLYAYENFISNNFARFDYQSFKFFDKNKIYSLINLIGKVKFPKKEADKK